MHLPSGLTIARDMAWQSFGRREQVERNICRLVIRGVSMGDEMDERPERRRPGRRLEQQIRRPPRRRKTGQ